MLAGEHVSAEFAAFLHERTEGVPLAVEELVRLMGDRADLARHRGGWVRRHLPEIDVPPTIRDAVLERAGRLGVDAAAVLQAAAVLAVPAGEVALRAVTGLPAGRARMGLAEALDSGLLTENAQGVSFRHVLAAQAVYEAITGPHRRLMHKRAGRALERAAQPATARLVWHFREAGETAKWCKYAEQAADLAVASGDEAAAAALLHDLVTGAGLPARSMSRLARKLPLASLTGPERYQALVSALRSVLDAGVSDPAVEAGVRVQLGRVLTAMEDYEAGRAELERAIPHLAHPADVSWALTHVGWPPRTPWPVSADSALAAASGRSGNSAGSPG